MRAPDFWRHDGPPARLLSPFGWAYDATGRLRRGLVRPWRAPVPVICVGNLVAGGAGKTPVALSLAALLIARGRRPHFLSRGHGGRLAGPVRVDPDLHGAGEVGDEALLLAAVAPSWVARDRAAGARAAVADGAEIIVMDDGMQNPGLAKDLSLMVIDGGYGFGNRRVMPAGPLRETLDDGLARADAAVLIGADETGAEAALAGRLPLLRARIEPLPTTEPLGGKDVLAFAGIGRPEKFFATLREMGCRLISARGFPDHHVFRAEEVAALLEHAVAAGAVAVTTAKDAVRLPPEARALVRVLEIDIAWRDEDAIATLIDSALARAEKREPTDA